MRLITDHAGELALFNRRRTLDGMAQLSTTDVIKQFNDAFLNHDPSLLTDLVADNCVMEAIQPAPDGERYVGRESCLGFWQALAADENSRFEVEDVAVDDDRSTVRWRLTFGPGANDAIRGVNLHLVRDGQIVESLGYAKIPVAVPLPE